MVYTNTCCSIFQSQEVDGRNIFDICFWVNVQPSWSSVVMIAGGKLIFQKEKGKEKTDTISFIAKPNEINLQTKYNIFQILPQKITISPYLMRRSGKWLKK